MGPTAGTSCCGFRKNPCSLKHQSFSTQSSHYSDWLAEIFKIFRLPKSRNVTNVIVFVPLKSTSLRGWLSAAAAVWFPNQGNLAGLSHMFFLPLCEVLDRKDKCDALINLLHACYTALKGHIEVLWLMTSIKGNGFTSTLKMKAVCSFDTLVKFCKITCSCNLQDHYVGGGGILGQHALEQLSSYIKGTVSCLTAEIMLSYQAAS